MYPLTEHTRVVSENEMARYVMSEPFGACVVLVS